MVHVFPNGQFTSGKNLVSYVRYFAVSIFMHIADLVQVILEQNGESDLSYNDDHGEFHYGHTIFG